MLQTRARTQSRIDNSPFPPPHTATADGLLAIGGNLSRARLVAAYRRGIFPWYGPGQPVLWWSPDPRCVLLPGRFHASRRLQRTLRRGDFEFTLDTAFARVIGECAAPRRRPGDAVGGGDGDNFRGDGDGDGDRPHTWITAEMARAYTALHRAGLAHSAEVWRDGQLIGGLYGVALGGVFYGESMFSRARDASKIALARLVELLRAWNYTLIDCQVSSPHLLRLGAQELPRDEFMARLQAALALPGKPGSWRDAIR